MRVYGCRCLPKVGRGMEDVVANARVYYGGQDFMVEVAEAESLDNQVWHHAETGGLPKMVEFETSAGRRVKVWVSESIPLAIKYPPPEGGSEPRRVARRPEARP